MKKLLLILFCLPIIGLGQTPNSVFSAELDTFIQAQMISNNIPLFDIYDDGTVEKK